MINLIAKNESDFQKIAKQLLGSIDLLYKSNDIKTLSYIELDGNLGAGKTTLMRHILRELGFAGKVKSPTYNFLESYDIDNFLHFKSIQHFDLYRFTHPELWLENGFDEYINSENLVFIEWASLAYKYLPRPMIKVAIDFDENITARLVSW